MEEGATEKFNCPVCLEIPEKEIYQCINGHIVCFACEEKLSQCPQCRVKMGSPKIRCRPLEDLLDRMGFDCANKPLGCATKLKRYQIQNHLKSCTYGTKTITLCKQLGFSCDFAITTKFLKEAVTHLKTSHDLITRETSHVLINLQHFDSAYTGVNSSYVPMVLDMTKETNKLFVLLSLIGKADHTLSFVCLEISENSVKGVASEFLCHFYIHTNNPSKKPDLTWTTKPLGAKYFASEINEPMHKFSISALSKNYAQNSVLAIKCSIERNVKSKETVQATHTTIVCPLRICTRSKKENLMNTLVSFQELCMGNSANDHTPSAPLFSAASAAFAAADAKGDTFVERPNQIHELARKCNYSRRQFEELKAKITEANTSGENLALLAVHDGKSRDELELMVQLGANWKLKEHDNWSVLHCAALNGNVDVAKYFLDLGADVNARNVDGHTPCHATAWCASSSRGIDVLHVLVQNGGDINAIDSNNESVLGYAKSQNRLRNRNNELAELIDEIKKLGGW